MRALASVRPVIQVAMAAPQAVAVRAAERQVRTATAGTAVVHREPLQVPEVPVEAVLTAVLQGQI